MTFYESRIILIYLALKYEGNYDQIMMAISLKEDPPLEEAVKAYESLKCKVITLLDYDYPVKLKCIYHPPVLLFYYGDITFAVSSTSVA